MSITSAYFWYTGDFWASDGGGGLDGGSMAPWTADAGIPRSSVIAISSLTQFYGAGDRSAANVGYLSYWTQKSRDGRPTEHTVSPGPELAFGLIPTFSDDDVVIITRAWHCFADEFVDAVGSFTVFVWG
jgi:hypothetical protein